MVGIVALLARHVGGWLCLYRMANFGTNPVPAAVQESFDRIVRRWKLRRQVRVVESTRVTVPALIGILRPIVLLPGSVLTGLTPPQLEAVLAHELAHVRRNDFLLNLVQTAAETLLFYHPAVWWISRRVRQERENCCDDLAISLSGDRLLYAQSLTQLELLCQGSAGCSAAKLSMAADGGSLLGRIRRILGRSPECTIRERVSEVCGASLGGAIVLFVAVVFSFSDPAALQSATAIAKDSAKAASPQTKRKTTKMTGLEVEFETPVALFEPGATVPLGNGDHRFDEIPEALRGRRFTQRNGYQGILRFRVLKPQVVYFAVYGEDWGGGGNSSGGWKKEIVTREQLAEQGWEESGELVGQHTVLPDSKLAWIVLSRRCNAGESFAIRTHKYQAPILFSQKAGSKAVEARAAASALPKLKSIDLGNDLLQIETHAADELQAGLVSVGLYPTRDLPNAKWVYESKLKNSLPAGIVELVGRLPGSYNPSDRFEVERFERVGSRITAVVAHYESEADNAAPPQAVYVRARHLPPLPVGTYTVEVSFRDYVAKGDQFEPAAKTRNPISCTFEISVDDPLPKELTRLAKAAIDIEPAAVFVGKTEQNSTGLDFANILRLTGQDKDRAAFSSDHRYFQPNADRLGKDRRTWALCSLLDYPNVDAKIYSLRALAKLADANSVGPLLAAAKRNNYFVAGSENATLHSIYRSSLKASLEKITGLSLTPKGLKATTTGADGKPRVIRSESEPEFFAEEVDFAQVENWLRRVYLAAAPGGEAKPNDNEAATILGRIEEPQDRGALSGIYQKVRGGDNFPENDELLAVPALDQLSKYIDYEGWFNVVNGKKKSELQPFATAQNAWLFFRSQQVSDNDRMWVERVERRGNEFHVTMRRAIWEGAYAANITFHELHGVNLGKLPAGEYTARWSIHTRSFRAFEENGQPGSFTPAEGKLVELQVSFTVAAKKDDDEKVEAKPSIGLQLRSTAPARIEQGMPLPVEIALRSDPMKLAPGMRRLNTFLHEAFLELRLTNQTTGKTTSIKPYDPTAGMPIYDDGKSSQPLDKKPLPTWNINFPLATAYESLPAGKYDGQVRFIFPEKKTVWWQGTDAQWKLAGFWHGAAVSQPFVVTIEPDARRKKKLLLPNELRLGKVLERLRDDDPNKTAIPIVSFDAKAAEEVEVPIRNGHMIAAKYYRNGELRKLAGPPKPGDMNPIDQWYDYRGGDRTIEYTIEVFETADRPQHFWHPRPGVAGYRVLWKKTLKISLEEEAFRRLP